MKVLNYIHRRLKGKHRVVITTFPAYFELYSTSYSDFSVSIFLVEGGIGGFRLTDAKEITSTLFELTYHKEENHFNRAIAEAMMLVDESTLLLDIGDR